METTLLLIRHGESQANLEKKFAGNWDVPLTERGEVQAELTAKFVTEKYKVDKIYSSDLIRAYSTAQAISSITGIDIIKREDLREIRAGKWEKKTFSDLAILYPDTYLNVWKNDIGKAICDGGESVKEVGERVIKCLTTIAKNNDGKTVAIATHATPIRTAVCLMKNEQIKNSVWSSNASVTEVKYIDGKWDIVNFSQDKHLESAKTTLPPNV